MRDFKIGDGVEIINYGHRKSGFENESVDSMPWLVGRTGSITEISGGKYAVRGIKEKYGWYDKEQLKLLK
jgi:hypothetical protein